MWIFTEIGYFSAVRADPPKDGKEEPEGPMVMVRGRVREDMERLANLIEFDFSLVRPQILEWPHRDYPYRVIISRQTWAEVTMELSERIEYGNFKDHVKKIDGQKRATLYSDVWSAMLSAERKLGLKASNKGAYDWEEPQHQYRVNDLSKFHTNDWRSELPVATDVRPHAAYDDEVALDVEKLLRTGFWQNDQMRLPKTERPPAPVEGPIRRRVVSFESKKKKRNRG